MLKIQDSSFDVTEGSRAEQYWNNEGWVQLFLKLRPGLKSPKIITNDTNSILKKYNLNGLGYGNWLSIGDKLNYTYALLFAMYDLNKVLRFNNNLGMGLLNVSFGARGAGRASAHYEPLSTHINITRYNDKVKPKELSFFTTGGLGALAHEYGHFLDYFTGEFLAKDNGILAITGGRSTSKAKTGRKGTIRKITDDLLSKIIWKKEGVKLSNYYIRLQKTVDSPYWFRRNELFARAFEVYIKEKLLKAGIKNRLLTSQKYDKRVYLTDGEMSRLIKLFDSLISEIRNKVI